MAAKAAVKDVGRAMDMPYAEVDRIAKMIPTTLGITIDSARRRRPSCKPAINSDPQMQDLIDMAHAAGRPGRARRRHAAGVVISPQPLTDLVPVYKTNRDEILTQYDMKALERIGLLKMDFLGLTTLTVLDDTLKMIEQNRGEDIDLQYWLDDAETYKQSSAAA